MTADYADLERRVTELEHQLRNVLPAKVDALAFGVSVLHEDLRAFRGETGERLGSLALRLDRHDERFDAIDARLTGHDERFDAIDTRLDRHGEMLGEILRRLPAGE